MPPEVSDPGAQVISILGGTALIIEPAAQGWLWAPFALHPDSLDPSTSRALLDVPSFWGPILAGATMTMIGAVTLSDSATAPGPELGVGQVRSCDGGRTRRER